MNILHFIPIISSKVIIYLLSLLSAHLANVTTTCDVQWWHHKRHLPLPFDTTNLRRCLSHDFSHSSRVSKLFPLPPQPL